MQRIAIFGSPGSGKSTLARQLGARTNLPVFFLDRYFFEPNWVIKPVQVFTRSMAQLVAEDRWITDGNYLSESITVGRLERADTLILLECSRLVCVYRVIRRALINFGQVRSDQAPGCPERFDWAFLRFVWHYPRRVGSIRQLLQAQATDKTVLFLRGNQQIQAFLQTLIVEPLG